MLIKFVLKHAIRWKEGGGRWKRHCYYLRLYHHTTGEPTGKGESRWRNLGQVSSTGILPESRDTRLVRHREEKERQAKEKSRGDSDVSQIL